MIGKVVMTETVNTLAADSLDADALPPVGDGGQHHNHDDRLELFRVKPSMLMHASWLPHLGHGEVLARLASAPAAQDAVSAYIFESLAACDGFEPSAEQVQGLGLVCEEVFAELGLSVALCLLHQDIRGILRPQSQRAFIAEFGRDAYLFAIKSVPLLMRHWPAAPAGMREPLARALAAADCTGLREALIKEGQKAVAQGTWHLPRSLRVRVALQLAYEHHDLFLGPVAEAAYANSQLAEQAEQAAGGDPEAVVFIWKLLNKLMRRLKRD